MIAYRNLAKMCHPGVDSLLGENQPSSVMVPTSMEFRRCPLPKVGEVAPVVEAETQDWIRLEPSHLSLVSADFISVFEETFCSRTYSGGIRT